MAWYSTTKQTKAVNLNRISMKTILLIILFITQVTLGNTFAQSLYTKAFGQAKNPALIFLHGGPGYNCANFEATTAQKLADKGFYIIVYDRRGEGRSLDTSAKFNFQETFADLQTLYQQFKIKQASLIGHSFGGIVATLFAEKHPEKVQAIFFVGVPISMQATFKTIIRRSKKIYQTKKDQTNLKYIDLLEEMDTSSLNYSSYCFMHAMQNGFYRPGNISTEAKAIYAGFKSNEILKKHAAKMTHQAPLGFWKNEHYTTLDLTQSIKNLRAGKMKLYGLYGKDDGLFSTQQVSALRKIIGKNKLAYFDDCSHNVFIDQQSQFITSIKQWLK